MACGCASCAAGDVLLTNEPSSCPAEGFVQGNAANMAMFPGGHVNRLTAAASRGRVMANFGCPQPQAMSYQPPPMLGTTPAAPMRGAGCACGGGSAAGCACGGGGAYPAGQAAPATTTPWIPLTLAFVAGSIFYATVYGGKKRK